MKPIATSKAGFTLVEIMIVVALIGLLSVMAIPNWVRARTNSQTTTCVNNLRQIDAAKQQWAVETKQATNSTPAFSEIQPYLKNIVLCPAGGSGATFNTTYTMNDVGTRPACQISPATHKLPPDSTN